MSHQSGLSYTAEPSSMSSAEIIQDKKEQILAVAARHGASNIRIFGSTAKSTTNQNCNIDFLVDLEKGRCLFDLGGLLVDLQQLFERNVNVVTENSLHWSIKDRILGEAKPI
jgi:predicted nucleotidyltransferase